MSISEGPDQKWTINVQAYIFQHSEVDSKRLKSDFMNIAMCRFRSFCISAQSNLLHFLDIFWRKPLFYKLTVKSLIRMHE